MISMRVICDPLVLQSLDRANARSSLINYVCRGHADRHHLGDRRDRHRRRALERVATSARADHLRQFPDHYSTHDSAQRIGCRSGYDRDPISR